MSQETKSTLVGISEITEVYLPVSKRKARRFVSLYLEPKRMATAFIWSEKSWKSCFEIRSAGTSR